MSDAMTNVGEALVAAQAKKARKAAPKNPKAQAPQTNEQAARAARFARAANTKPVITLDSAARLIPSHDQIAAIVRSFGLDDVDYADIRDKTEEAFVTMARAIEPSLSVAGYDGSVNTKGFEMHLQRLAGAFVGSAYGAASFYETKRQAARELSSGFANDDRDEDRMGIDGQANRAQRAREFAAQLALKAYATVAAAEGALSAYEHMIGSPWKPYEGATEARSIARDAAKAQADALGI